jgi:hypothetical protein
MKISNIIKSGCLRGAPIRSMPTLEAVKTSCQTRGVRYNTNITPGNISINLVLPTPLDLSDEESKLLEANIHNALELVLDKYYYVDDGPDV